MKLKSLAALGMASLLAASIAYVSPVLAADDVTANIGSDESMPAPTDNGMQQTDTTTAPSNDTTVTPNNNDTSSSSTSDQGTPDTATGDDDY